MSTLFFDVINSISNEPDWSGDDDDELSLSIQKEYSSWENYHDSDLPPDDFKWLKPPEDWKKSEALNGI